VRTPIGGPRSPHWVWLLLVGAALAACSDVNEDLPYAPSNCNPVKPSFGTVIVTVSKSAAHPTIPLIVYQGNYEDGLVVVRDTVDVAQTGFEVPVDTYYAVIARYTVGVDTILVLNGGRLEVNSETYRDATCYGLPTLDLDLRLR
jgi:hypothetical protein